MNAKNRMWVLTYCACYLLKKISFPILSHKNRGICCIFEKEKAEDFYSVSVLVSIIPLAVASIIGKSRSDMLSINPSTCRRSVERSGCCSEKELVYRYIEKRYKLIQYLQTWVLPLIFD